MFDANERSIDYLRLSVTERCNLRCRYCVPNESTLSDPSTQPLSYTQLVRLAEIFVKLGVRRIRITGGEPLVREGLEGFVKQLSQLQPLPFLALTTNGTLLNEHAKSLYTAGIRGVNISLDTTDAHRYAHITKGGNFQHVWQGIRAALAHPFSSVRLNCVISQHSTPCDWMGVISLAKDLPLDVRLIDCMPISDKNSHSCDEKHPIPCDAFHTDEQNTSHFTHRALMHIERAFGPLCPDASAMGEGPAQYFSVNGFKGRIGIIPATSGSFCATCNRVRLSSEGMLRTCLFQGTPLALAALLHGGATDAHIAQSIQQALLRKPLSYAHTQNGAQPAHIPCSMAHIGG